MTLMWSKGVFLSTFVRSQCAHFHHLVVTLSLLLPILQAVPPRSETETQGTSRRKSQCQLEGRRQLLPTLPQVHGHPLH